VGNYLKDMTKMYKILLNNFKFRTIQRFRSGATKRKVNFKHENYYLDDNQERINLLKSINKLYKVTIKLEKEN